MPVQLRHVGGVLLLALLAIVIAAGQCRPVTPQPPTATPWVMIVTATFTPTVPPTEGPSPTPSPTPPTPPPLPPTATKPPSPPPTFTPPPVPQPPVAQIIAPANGTQYFVGQVVQVQFTAGSQAGVSRVTLYVGGTQVSSRDYAHRPTVIRNDTLSWTASAAGNYTVRVVAYDPYGNPSTPDQRNIVVQPQVVAPTVRIDYPARRVVIQVYQNIQIQATIDGAVGLKRLELVERKDNREVVYVSDTNYHNVSYQWRVPWQSAKAGDHTLFIRAWDTNNRMGQSSDFIIGATDDNPPQVQVNYSTTTLDQGGNLKVHVEAVDSAGVNKITLRVNDNTVDKWDAPDPAVGQVHVSVDLWWRNAGPPGTYNVYVRAQDTTEQRTDTSVQQVTVKQGQPTPVPANVVGKWEGGEFQLHVTEQRPGGKLIGTLRAEDSKRKAIYNSRVDGRSVTVHAQVRDTEYNFILTLSDDGKRLVGHWSTTQTGLLTPITLNKVQGFQ